MDSRSITRPFPGFSQLYTLDDPLGRAYRGEIELDDPVAATRGESRQVGPAVIRWAMGSGTPTDVIHTTYAMPVAVHDRVVQLLKELGFSGWGTYPVDVFDKTGRMVPGYHGLSIRGRCGRIDDSRCEPILKRMPGGVFPFWRGLYFEPDRWDGSDIFMAEDAGWKFVTSEVKRAIARAKVRNCGFTRLDQVERPTGATSLGQQDRYGNGGV